MATHQVDRLPATLRTPLGSKKVRLALAAATASVVGLLIPGLFGGSGPSGSHLRTDPAATPAVASTTPPTSPPPGDRMAYYMSFDEVDGLPLDTEPWTPVELWVTWDPPITDEPLAQKLSNDVYVESVLPPVVPGSGHVVKFSIRHKDREPLVYADRYGSISVFFDA
ncbi:MAG: hypothetical protein ACLGHL_07315 [Actinomycetota bacterium]